MKRIIKILFPIIVVTMSVSGGVISSASNFQKAARVSRWQPAVDETKARATGQRRTSTIENLYASLRDPTSSVGPENDQRKEMIANAIDSRGSEKIPFQEYEYPITLGRNRLSLRYWEMKLPETETVSTCTFIVLTDESGKTLWVGGEGQAGFRMRSEIHYRIISNSLQLRVAVIDAPSAQREGYIEWDIWEYSPQSGKVSYLRTMKEKFQ